MSNQVKGRALTPDEKYRIMSHCAATALSTWAKTKGIKNLSVHFTNERMKIGDLIYKVGFTAAEKRLLNSREGWFGSSTAICATVWDGQRKHRLDFSMSQRRFLPSNAIDHRWNTDAPKNELVFEADTEVSKLYVAALKLEGEYNEVRRKVDQELRSVFDGRVTAQQVMKRWPEIANVFPGIKELAKETKQQVVIVTQALNAALGYAS